MTASLDLLIACHFCLAVVAIARLDHRKSDRDHAIAWFLGGTCTLAILASLTYDRDLLSLVRAVGTAAALGLLPLSARVLYRDGIDLLDATVSAFSGFVLGVSSWSAAWKVMVGAAVIAGLLAMFDLLATNETPTRISFGYVLATLAIFASGVNIFTT